MAERIGGTGQGEGAGVRSWRARGESALGAGVAVGTGVGFLVAAGALALLTVSNPFFVDRVDLAVLLVVLPLGLIGCIIGAVVGAVTRAVQRKSRGARRGGSASPGPAGRSVRKFLLVAFVIAVCVSIVGGAVARRAELGPRDPSVKLLLVGVDGASWMVAGPMLDRGELPNLAAAIQSGTSGELTSLKPLYSTRIFTTIASGKTAEKHGIGGISDLSADAVLVKRIWEILSEQLGWDYGLVEWYVTWPPTASPGGFVIPSLIAASTETVPPDLSFVRELRDLGKITRDRRIAQFVGITLRSANNGVRLSTLAELAGIALATRTSGPIDLYSRQQRALVRVISDATCYSVMRSNVEMLAIVYKSTDSVSHKYWSYYEPEAFPGTDPESVERYGEVIEGVYSLVDQQVGRLKRYLAPGATMLIFSDHGFQASKSIGASPVTYRVETLLSKLGFSLSDVTYVNFGGTFYLQPLTLDERESLQLTTRLEEVFSSLTIAESGEPAFYVERVDNEGTRDDYVSVGFGESLIKLGESDPLVRAADGTSVRASEFLTRMDISGTHAPEGILVAVGEPFKSGARFGGATVLDITPTILAAVDLPVADDMDGVPLVDAMTGAFLASHPISSIPTYETEVRTPQRSESIEDMSEDTKERLRSLGYIQ